MKSLLIMIPLLLLALPAAGHSVPDPAELRRIQILIERIEHSGLVFERNGSRYSSAEAAAHLRSKLDAAGNRVTTTEQFITHIASRSYFTGRPYYVITPRGRVTAESWLRTQLEQ